MGAVFNPTWMLRREWIFRNGREYNAMQRGGLTWTLSNYKDARKSLKQQLLSYALIAMAQGSILLSFSQQAYLEHGIHSALLLLHNIFVNPTRIFTGCPPKTSMGFLFTLAGSMFQWDRSKEWRRSPRICKYFPFCLGNVRVNVLELESIVYCYADQVGVEGGHFSMSLLLHWPLSSGCWSVGWLWNIELTRSHDWPLANVLYCSYRIVAWVCMGAVCATTRPKTQPNRKSVSLHHGFEYLDC